MRSKLYISFIFLFPFSFFLFPLNAQDIHFSQFNFSPLNLNPALTGLFDADYRFVGNHKNQWRSINIPAPYNTFSGSFDGNFFKSKLGKDFWGGGVVIFNDRAGDSELSTTQFNISTSYIRKLDDASRQYLSFGIQNGIVQKSINYSNLKFDSQYDGSRFDPNLSNQESFMSDSRLYYDFSTGVSYLFKPKRRMMYNVGISFSHLTMPRQSFLGNKKIRLDPKITFHGNSLIKIRRKMDLMPSFMVLKQGKFKEIVVGSFIRFLTDEKIGSSALYLGGWYRVGDAIYYVMAFDFRNMKVGISYDINISKLRVASQGRGGIEVAIIYIFRRFQPIYKQQTGCPLF
ncbi:PorP/SprF family type IX secretion system membrane protein [Bacteroidales bacterium AH-315-N07]|nr:PorP/SprF family type IX secretion system membrane protein [Bacteroidales bacterium AH-315-N07]